MLPTKAAMYELGLNRALLHAVQDVIMEKVEDIIVGPDGTGEIDRVHVPIATMLALEEAFGSIMAMHQFIDDARAKAGT